MLPDIPYLCNIMRDSLLNGIEKMHPDKFQPEKSIRIMTKKPDLTMIKKNLLFYYGINLDRIQAENESLRLENKELYSMNDRYFKLYKEAREDYYRHLSTLGGSPLRVAFAKVKTD